MGERAACIVPFCPARGDDNTRLYICKLHVTEASREAKAYMMTAIEEVRRQDSEVNRWHLRNAVAFFVAEAVFRECGTPVR